MFEQTSQTLITWTLVFLIKRLHPLRRPKLLLQPHLYRQSSWVAQPKTGVFRLPHAPIKATSRYSKHSYTSFQGEHPTYIKICSSKHHKLLRYERWCFWSRDCILCDPHSCFCNPICIARALGWLSLRPASSDFPRPQSKQLADTVNIVTLHSRVSTLHILKYVRANITNSWDMNAGVSDQETASSATPIAASGTPSASPELLGGSA